MKPSLKRATTSSSPTTGELPSDTFPRPWNPDRYQKKSVKWLLENAASCLFLDTGLGKTSIAYATLKIMKKAGLFRRALVIAPLRPCHLVWPAEQKKWTDFRDISVTVLHGHNKDDLLKAKSDVFIINPDGLEWLLDAEVLKSEQTNRRSVKVNMKRFRAMGFDTLIVDELTMFKHISSVRFRMLKEIIHTFGRRWGFTATPMADHVMDLFGQVYVIDAGRTFGQYITHFRHRYFVPDRDGFTWHLKEDAEQQIYERLSPLALRMDADDYMDLPPVVDNIIDVDIGAKARMAHNELLDELVTKIEAGTIVAANAGVASGKCRQVTGGAVYRDMKEDGWTRVHDAKLDALADLVESLQGNPVLVAYEFRHEIERIQARLKKLVGDIPVIGGGTTTRQLVEYEAGWNRNAYPVMLVHPQSVGHGLNLQGGSARHIAWFTPPWSNELHYQLVRRLRRRGTKAKRIFSHFLLATGTIDRYVYDTLGSKERGQQALFTALKKLSKTRK